MLKFRLFKLEDFYCLVLVNVYNTALLLLKSLKSSEVISMRNDQEGLKWTRKIFVALRLSCSVLPSAFFLQML